MTTAIITQPTKYSSVIQRRYAVYCSRYGIPSDKVTFQDANNVKIKCGKVFHTLQTATSLLGYIPYVFRKAEGLADRSFEFRFEGNYCFIRFRKSTGLPTMQKKLLAYMADHPMKEMHDTSFISNNLAKVVYGKLTPSKFTNGELLRRIPYEFRVLQKLFNLPTTFEYNADGYCYITFKK